MRPHVATDVPTLDEHQQRVVDHPGGPLLVLAGPGTGKTTTLVEAIVRRIDQGARPDEILALTFSRKAAEQLRDRVTARLGRTMSTNLSSTFHSFAYGLIRAYAPAELYAAPLRLLRARAGRGAPGAAHRQPGVGPLARELRAAVGTRGFAARSTRSCPGPASAGSTPPGCVALGRREGIPEFEAAACSSSQYLDVLGDQSAIDYPDLIARAVIEAEVHRDELRARFTHVFVDEYQDTDPSQVALLRALAGDGRDLTVVGDPDQSIYGFRGADVRGILDFPAEFPHGRRRPGAGGRARHHPPLRVRGCCGPRERRGLDRDHRRHPAEDVRRVPPTRRPPRTSSGPARSRCSPSTPPGPRPSTSPTCCAAPTSRTASAGPRWRCWSGRALQHPRACAARSPPPASRSRWPATRRRWSASRPCCRCSARWRVVVDAEIDDPTHDDFVGADRAEALLTSPLGGLDATDVRRSLTRALRRPRPWRRPPATWSGGRARPRVLDGLDGEPARRALRLADLVARCARQEPPGGRRHGGGGALDVWDGSDWGPAARSRPRAAARAPGWPTATSTRSARCSSRRPGPRSRRATPACASSSPRCGPRRSRPTRSPTAGSAARRSGC